MSSRTKELINMLIDRLENEEGRSKQTEKSRAQQQLMLALAKYRIEYEEDDE